MDVQPVLPDSESVRLVRSSLQKDLLTFTVISSREQCPCPRCNHLSRRVHSRYHRRLLDSPFASIRIGITWINRKFFCDNEECTQKIFTERIPRMAEPYARRTRRLDEYLKSVVLNCGAEAGARLVCQHGLVTSPDTLLRLIRHMARPPVHTPRVLVARGFKGSYHLVRRYVATWRRVGSSQVQGHEPTRRISARTASWLLVRQRTKLTQRERTQRAALLWTSRSVRHMSKLISTFRDQLMHRQPHRIARWVRSALAENFSRELRQYAKGIMKDFKAVVLAAMLPWSNGQTEGQVNRLKSIKRQMLWQGELRSTSTPCTLPELGESNNNDH